MKGSVDQGKRRPWIASLLLAGALTVLTQAGIARAGHSACRTDPVVTLSNGVTVTMVEDIGADASAVQGISYTLNAPRGTTITRIDYYGPVAPELQQVTLVANQDATHYHVQTNVSAGTNSIALTASLLVGNYSASANGHTNADVNLGVNNR